MTPDELAGVLAHEAAHVTKRHGLRQIISSVGPYLVLSAFFQGQDGFLSVIGGGAQVLITQNFSQKYEIEADDVAWDYMKKAKMNPHAFIDALEKLRKETEALERMQIKALSSHPPTSDRIKRLKGKWDKIKR
jgi:Zn-dependent protease with chaperone function